MVVYSLLDPNDGLIRYIGITSLTASKRFSVHLKDAKTKRKKGLYMSKKEKWLLQLNDNNQKPIICTLFRNITKEKAENLEIALIAQYKRVSDGGILFNVQSGGAFHSDLMTPWNKGKHGCYSKEFLENNKIQQPNSKEVFRFDKDGNLIDKWRSTREMCATLNLDRRCVMRCLHNEANFKSHKRFMFSYFSNPPTYVNNSKLLSYSKSPHAKPILVTYPDESTESFSCIREASEKLKIHPSCISEVMKTTKKYKQFKFKFI